MNPMEFYRFGPLLGKTIIKEELRLELLETGIIQTMDARKALVGHIENEKEYSIELRKKIIIEIILPFYENKIISSMRSILKWSHITTLCYCLSSIVIGTTSIISFINTRMLTRNGIMP
jgi:hypothetical protein